MYNTIFISDSNLTTFGRKVGSKDKQPRNHTLRNVALGASGLAVAGGLGYLALKNKVKPPIDKKALNTLKVKQRLNLLKNAGTENVRNASNDFEKEAAQDYVNRLGRTRNADEKMLGIYQQQHKDEVKRSVNKLRKNKAYMSASTTFISEFARKKGSKDKQKRSVGIAKRAVGGIIGGVGGAALTGIGLGLTKAALAKSEKNPQLLNNLTKHTRTAVIGGAALGAGVGASTDGKQLQEGRRVVSTANRTSQELRGYISLGKRYGIL